MHKMVWLVTIWVVALLAILSAESLCAQSFDTVPVELALEGESPILPIGQRDHFFADDAKGTIWLGTHSQIWSFSIDSLRFTSWPKVLFEDKEVQMGFDKAGNRFLFWNHGVGKVYTWQPGDTTLTRIDRSNHHRTQFDHAWFIDPMSGNIYAFGGYGFWQSRGYTSRYDHTIGDWHLLPINSSNPYPAPRNSAMHVYDAARSQFHVFGGRTASHQGRDDLSVDNVGLSDYWVLDVPSKKWIEQPLYGLATTFDANKTLSRVDESSYNGVIDSVGDLAWYPVRNPEPPFDIKLFVFDLKRSFGALSPISLGEYGINKRIYRISFNMPTNRLIMLWSPSVKLDGDQRLRVSTLQLPSADSTRAMMDLIQRYGSYQTSIATSRLNWTWILPFSLIFAVFFYLHKTKTFDKRVGRGKSNLRSITFCYVGEPEVRVNNVDLTHKLTNGELALVMWMYWKHIQGEPYQITDDIEKIIWPYAPNADYARKQRNTSIRRLNVQLNSTMKTKNMNRTWVVDRLSQFDKRKREYALDLSGIVVHCDLLSTSTQNLDPSLLLESCNDRWATEIRNEFMQRRLIDRASA